MDILVNNAGVEKYAPFWQVTEADYDLVLDINLKGELKALLENIPLARLGKTSDVAGVAAFLASADADCITGATIVVDGGLTWNYSEQ